VRAAARTPIFELDGIGCATQNRVEELTLINARIAQDAARRALEAAVACLAKAHLTQSSAARTLACARALRVAGQRHREALAQVADAQVALRDRDSIERTSSRRLRVLAGTANVER
jgi:hypothetical protein